MGKPGSREITNGEGDHNSIIHTTKERLYWVKIIHPKLKNDFMKVISNPLIKKRQPFFNLNCEVNKGCMVLIPSLILCAFFHQATAQKSPGKVEVPEWALPGSATHKQVPPPLGFHRTTRTDFMPIGIFEGQSDVGGALVPGSSSYKTSLDQYSITSAGYNVWYTRDEFRYLWKKMSGDVSLAADINFPDTAGYDDRKAILVIRQSLDDDSKEAMVALHGGGLVHLAWRREKEATMMEMRVDTHVGVPDGRNHEDSVMAHARRLGIEKKGDYFSIYISMEGEPMYLAGPPIKLHLDGPFYAGIGFCSHQPVKTDMAKLSNLVLVDKAGGVR
jgi:hypothetical protein